MAYSFSRLAHFSLSHRLFALGVVTPLNCFARLHFKITYISSEEIGRFCEQSAAIAIAQFSDRRLCAKLDDFNIDSPSCAELLRIMACAEQVEIEGPDVFSFNVLIVGRQLNTVFHDRAILINRHERCASRGE
jgi:hypothetical protein